MTDHDELRERVAIAIMQSGAGSTYGDTFRTMADAAIALMRPVIRAETLEEAARVVERTTTYEDIADRSPEEWFRMGRIIASVIRTLKE